MSDKQRITEEERLEWLEAVHFGSCCRDPIEIETVAIVAESKQTIENARCKKGQ